VRSLPDVTAGSTMVFVAGGRRVPMRALAACDATDSAVPVLATSEVLQLGTGHVEIATASGLVTAPGRVVRDGAGGLALRLAGREVTQRREAVRGDVELSLRVAVRDGASAAPGQGRVVRGRTVNVSAGGLLALLDVNPDGLVQVGAELPAEVTLPSGDQVAAVLQVVEVRGWWIRTAFADIDPRSREKLVRLVFTRERAALAQRRERRAVEVREQGPVSAGRAGRSPRVAHTAAAGRRRSR
jgi:hypothetical protein